MDSLFDKKFISSKEASELSGYHSDYLARLCRSEKILGSRVGRTWVINRDSLLDFIQKQEVQNKKNAKKLAVVRQKEYRVAKEKREAVKSAAPVKSEWVQVAVPSRFQNQMAAAVATLVIVNGALLVGSSNALPTASRVAVENIRDFGTFYVPALVTEPVETLRLSHRTLGEMVVARLDGMLSVYMEGVDLAGERLLTVAVETRDVGVGGSVAAGTLAKKWVSFSQSVSLGAFAFVYNIGDFGMYEAGLAPQRTAYLYSESATALGASVYTVAVAVENNALGVIGNIALGYDTGRANVIAFLDTRVVQPTERFAKEDSDSLVAAAVLAEIPEQAKEDRKSVSSYSIASGTDSARQIALSGTSSALEQESVLKAQRVEALPELSPVKSPASSTLTLEATIKAATSTGLTVLTLAPPTLSAAAAGSVSAVIADAGEEVALYTYEMISGLFHNTSASLASLFVRNTNLVINFITPDAVAPGSSVSVPGTPAINNVANYFTFTGVSFDYLERRLAMLREQVSNDIYDSIDNNNNDGGGGSGSVTSVDASGGTTGLSFAGGPITSTGTLTLSGVLNIANGGTGLSTAPAYGELMVGDGLGGYALLATSSLGIGAGSGSPGGANTQVQFNNGGLFAGDAGFTYNAATDLLTVVNGLFTSATTTAFGINTETFTDLTGTGLQNVGGVLTLDATGNWTGTFDGQEGSYYLANSFSTTSASYFLSQNQQAAFSTTSANYWETQQTARTADDLTNNSIEDLSDVAAMTEALGNLLSWNGSAWTNVATSTLGFITQAITSIGPAGQTADGPTVTMATSTGSFNGLTTGLTITGAGDTLTYTPALSGTLNNAGLSNSTVSYGGITLSLGGTDATPAFNLIDATDLPIVAGTTGTLTVARGGTGTTTAPSGQVLYGGGAGVYQSVATTSATIGSGLSFSGTFGALLGGASGTLSLNATGNWTGTFDGQEGSYYLSRANHTGTQAASTISDFDAAVASYINASTTILNDTTESGLEAFLTDVSNVFTNNDGALADDNLADNSIEDLSDVAAMTESFGDLLSWNGSTWLNIATSTLGIDLSDTTGILAQDQGGTGIASYTAGDLLYVNALGTLATLPIGSAGQVLKVTGGLPQWGVDISTGGGGGAGAWATTSDSLAIYPADSSDVVIVGNSATTTANSILEVFGRSYFSNLVGIGTTTPGAMLSVAGNAIINGATTIFGGVNAPIYTATSTTATSTLPNLFTSAFRLGSDYLTDITGTGLSVVGGALTLDATGNWTGTFDGQEGSYYLANSFSTTSANYWETQQTSRSADDLTNNSIEDLNDVAAMTETLGDLLSWNGSAWTNVATSTLGFQAAGSYESPLTFTYPLQRSSNTISLAFGTTTANTWGAHNIFTSLFASNASSTNATTTALGINSETFTDLTGTGLQNVGGVLTLNATGNWTGTFDGQEGSYYLDRANHTGTQAASTISDFSTAVASYITASTTLWQDTTEASLETFLTDVTNVFTNNDGALTDDDLTNNSIEDLSDVAAMTENYGDLLFWNGSAWADIATSSLGLVTGAGGSDTQVQYNNAGALAGDAGFTYNASADRLTATFASTTGISSSYASSTNLFAGTFTLGSLTGVLKATAGAVSTGLVNLATEVTGTLGITNGGTGTSTPGVLGQVLSWNGTNWQGVATSTLGFLSQAVTAIGPAGQTADGPTVTMATSTGSFNGLTTGLTIVGSGDTLTYTPSITGTLNNAGLTNSTVSYGGITLSLGGSDATPAFNLVDATGLPISTGISGLGTGVATALGVNVGTAGSFVVNGGALGTPSSGTLTNATGLPIVAGTTGTLTVARGGTGTTTAPSGQVLYGGGSGVYQSVATTSATIGSGLSYSGTFGALLGGAAGTLSVDDVTPAMLQAADFGDFTCNGTSCSLDADTVSDSEIDYATVTLADFTNDAGFLTTVDISANTNLAATYPLVLTNDTLSLAFGTTTSNTWAGTQTFGNLSATNATTTSFGINSETFTDLTGTGLQNVGGVLTLNATGNWTGTFDGQEGSYYLSRANHTGTQAASTISDFDATVASYINASTTILNDTTESGLEAFLTDVSNVFTNNDGALSDDDLTNNSIEDLSDVAAMTENYGDLLYWNGSAWADIATSSLGLVTGAGGSDTQVQYNNNGVFGGDAGFTYNASADRLTTTFASTTGISSAYASSTSGFFGNLSIGALTGVLKATAGAVSTGLVNLASEVTGTLPIGNGGTGASSLADNRVLTGGTTVTDEANLTFDGSTLTVTGSAVISTQLTSPIITANNSTSNSNFRVGAATGINAQSAASGLLFAGASNVQQRVFFNGTTATTLTADAAYGGVIVGAQPVTEAGSGTHAAIAGLVVNAPVITDGAGATTDATTLYIAGAPTGITPTNAATALWIDDGIARFDGTVGIGIGTPQKNLHIHASGDSFTQWTNSTTGTNSSDGLYIGHFSGSGAAYMINQEAFSLIFGTGGLSRMFLTNTGNLGVSTSTPYARLSSGLSSSGVGLALDALSGYAGNFVELKVASTTVFSINQAGSATIGTNIIFNGDTFADLTGAGLTVSGSALTVDDVTPAMLQSADFGEFTCNGTTCSLDAESQSIEELSDVAAMTENFGDLLYWNGSTWTDIATSSLGITASAVTAIGPAEQTQSGPTITLATSTASFNGLTTGLTIVGSTNTLTFTPSLSGTLTVGGGGTGGTTFTNNRLLTGNGTGAFVDEANLTFDGSLLTVTGNASTTLLTTTGSTYLATTGGSVMVGTTTTASLPLEVVTSTATASIRATRGLNISAPTTAGGSAFLAIAQTGYGAGVITEAAGASAWSLIAQHFGTGNDTRVSLGGATYSALFELGNVGIGTTTPYRRLAITDAVSTAQTVVAYDTTNFTELLTTSVGDLMVYPSGNDFSVNNGNIFACAGGSGATRDCVSGSPSGQGNIIAETAIGIATSTPWAGLTLASGKAILVAENTLATSTSMTIDWRNGNQQLVRLGTAGTTISFSSFLDGQKLVLTVCNPAAGTTGTITWGTQVLWAGGTAPTQTTTLNKCDVWSFLATAATSTTKIFGTQSANF